MYHTVRTNDGHTVYVTWLKAKKLWMATCGKSLHALFGESKQEVLNSADSTWGPIDYQTLSKHHGKA